MKWADRPVIVVGHGCTGIDLSRLYTLGVPILSSWQAADLIDNTHPLYFGRPGIYGQRTANKVLYEADQIIALGCRMCAWMIGHAGLRPEQKLIMVDIDPGEIEKFPGAEWGGIEIGAYIAALEPRTGQHAMPERFPLVEAAHDDAHGYINSYRFMERLQPLLRPDEVICVDNGCLTCPVFQVLQIKPPQRVMTSGCLGEMGCALPAAVGASFARGKGEVLCMVGDGGMSMNLQELSTIAHHQLPVKIIVFENDGYCMIKATYTNVKKPRQGVDRASGLSFPDYRKLAQAWGFPAGDIRTWNDFDLMIPNLLRRSEPALVVVHIDPEQAYVPRLQPIIKDGVITPARFDTMSPLL